MRWIGWFGVAVWVAVAGGQTLAHKNWQGSGMSVEAWWARAMFCAAGSDLKRVAGEMDELERMGCDAVEVVPGHGAGAVAEMDGVIDGAGRRKMRVVVELSGAASEDEAVAGLAFWGARGAAGFALRGVAVNGRVRQAAGGRLVIGEGGQLRRVMLPDGDAGALRVWMAGRQGAGMLLASTGTGYARTAMAMLSGGAAEVPADAVVAGTVETAREFSAEEMLLWVPKGTVAANGVAERLRELGEMRRKSESSRGGRVTFLNLDAAGVVGWTVAGQGGRSRLVLCNVSGKAVTIPMDDRLREAGIRGTLVPVGRVEGGALPREISLEAEGVFVGEVR